MRTHACVRLVVRVDAYATRLMQDCRTNDCSARINDHRPTIRRVVVVSLIQETITAHSGAGNGEHRR